MGNRNPINILKRCKAEVVQGIYTLDCEGVHLHESDARQIVSVREVIWLSLKSTNVSDLDCEWISMLPLRFLSISSTSITGEGISVLSSMPALEVLHASDMNGSDPFFRSIGELKSLKSVELVRTGLDFNSLQELVESLPSLETVGAVENGLSVLEMECAETRGEAGNYSRTVTVNYEPGKFACLWAP